MSKSGTRTVNRQVSRTDSDVACEEAARLTAEQEGDAQDEDGMSYCDYHDIPPPPDGGYGWVICFASFMCNMIVDGIAYTFGVFLGEFVNHYDQPKGRVAWVGSLLSGMYLSAGPIVSALANKYGCRTVCIVGSFISTSAFILSTFSPTINVLMITYGFMGGVGFGMIYLPAVVCVGYYFETKRSLATGIAVCGSGVGTFAFAPLATMLLDAYGWKGANIILAGLILNCAVFGALMRPLEYPKSSNVKPLLQRMAEERRFQMERGSIGGSYFMVQLPDGTMEKRMKQHVNIDPGVHSSLNLDQLAPGTPITPIPTVPTLPTIAEGRIPEYNGSDSSNGSATDLKANLKNPRIAEITHQEGGRVRRDSGNDGSEVPGGKGMPRNASQPAFTTHVQGLPKNGSVPFFDRIRKTSLSERYKPSLNPIRSSSRGTMNSNGNLRKSSSFVGSRNNNADDQMDTESMNYTNSKLSLAREKPLMVRPMSRKDIFYSGSILNLPEYQSQKSLTNYRQSVISIPRPSRNEMGDVEKGEACDMCPCLVLPESFKSALSQMMDFSLLKDPVFMLIAVSNLFGMAGLYVPFVYLVDCAKFDGIESGKASFLLSIIGITNTVGRIACGYFADFPQVNALFVNNCCLIISTISVAVTPFCHSYGAYMTTAIFFGIAVSGYISLTSIILVDLLGLDKLTNAFGLLILFRGAATIVGSPMAGALYDSTQSYSVPFFVAGGLFGISAATSFIAPYFKKSLPEEQPVMIDDALTPIDEDEEEEDGPITMGNTRTAVPTIIETASSPAEKEIKQLESVL